MTPRDIAVAQDGARLAGFLPYLKAEVDGMEHALDNRIFQLIKDKALTPEVALQAWLEKLSYHRLYHRFETRVKVGLAVGERSASDLQIGE